MNRNTIWAVTAAAILLTACANTPPPMPAQSRVDEGANMITPMTQNVRPWLQQAMRSLVFKTTAIQRSNVCWPFVPPNLTLTVH